jgi:SAM-dependent methyltransferase
LRVNTTSNAGQTPGKVEIEWPLRLFNKSVLKQEKFRRLINYLGSTEGLHCLDIGSDNGVISLLLRRRGGSWKSADLDSAAVRAIRELVKTDVYQIDGGSTPFESGEFDRVVIVDFLEHIPNEAEFVRELSRILKPDGELVVNVPHIKNSWLRRFRQAIGQTDEKHGHLRPGYTIQSLSDLLEEHFAIQEHTTYSKFFSEFVDTLVVLAVSKLKGSSDPSKKGVLVTGDDLSKYQSSFKMYALIYPLIWFFSKLDGLLFLNSGYMLIARASAHRTQ